MEFIWSFPKDAFEICIFSSTLGQMLLTLMMRRKRRKMECNAQFVYSNYQQKQVRKINCGFLSGLIFTIIHFHIPLWKKFTILQTSTTLQELCFDFLFLSKIAHQQQQQVNFATSSKRFFVQMKKEPTKGHHHLYLKHLDCKRQFAVGKLIFKASNKKLHYYIEYNLS